MQARFSLQGELLAPDVDLPTHLGLHHHGEEAEVRHGAQEDWAAFNNHVGKALWSDASDLLCDLFQFMALLSSQVLRLEIFLLIPLLSSQLPELARSILPPLDAS